MFFKKSCTHSASYSFTQVWFFLEGGLIGNFGRDGKAPVSEERFRDLDFLFCQVMISVEARYDDGVVMEAVVEKFVKYFKSIFHHNPWYFVYFVTCGYNVVLFGHCTGELFTF